jgi:hypothetical protein
MSANFTTPDDTGGISNTIGWLDLTFFGLMLGSSTLIGVYFGFWGKKEDTPKEYLHGGKAMGTIPVAVSLVSRSVCRKVNDTSLLVIMKFPVLPYRTN